MKSVNFVLFSQSGQPQVCLLIYYYSVTWLGDTFCFSCLCCATVFTIFTVSNVRFVMCLYVFIRQIIINRSRDFNINNVTCTQTHMCTPWYHIIWIWPHNPGLHLYQSVYVHNSKLPPFWLAGLQYDENIFNHVRTTQLEIKC